MIFSLLFRCIALCLPPLLCACATTRPIEVIEEKGFLQMARTLRADMRERNLLDANAAYLEPLSRSDRGTPYGDILYRQLSPSFMFDDTVGHVYLGETFHATRTPRSRVQQRSHGFTIHHPTQTLRVTMLAITDWNGDGEKEWIVSCRTDPLRGGRSREYYLAVPPPKHPSDRLNGTVLAVNDCFGLACTLYVKKSSAARHGARRDGATSVEDVTPGLENVTEAPLPASGHNGGNLEERAL